MNKFSDLIATRRSMRKFTTQKLSDEQKQTILRAALISPTAKNNRGWEFVTVEDPAMLEKLSKCRAMGSGFLAEAVFAVVVLGDPSKSDCWIEDCSIAAINMQLQAEDLGLGSCWCHMRGRADADGKSTKQTLTRRSSENEYSIDRIGPCSHLHGTATQGCGAHHCLRL